MPNDNTRQEVTFDLLDAFADAWNRHDVDAIMSAMTEDCIFEASAGVGVKGGPCTTGSAKFGRAWKRFSPNSQTPSGVSLSTSLRATEE